MPEPEPVEALTHRAKKGLPRANAFMHALIRVLSTGPGVRVSPRQVDAA